MINSANIPDNELDILRTYFPKGVVALDLETTGLSPLIDKVIELSAIKITPHSVEIFSELINPQIPIPEHTIAIHGITNSMVAKAPESKIVFPKFFAFTEKLPIIAHNAKFDIGFLVFGSHQLGLELTSGQVYCSCQMAKKCISGVPNHKLSILAAHLEIDLLNHHRAFDDALACLRIYARSLLSCNQEKIQLALKESFQFKIDDFKKLKEDGPSSKKISSEVFEQLKKAVTTQAPIKIRYSGGSYKNELRPIRPISLLPLPGGDVLYALCLLSNYHKSFALHKIKEVV